MIKLVHSGNPTLHLLNQPIAQGKYPIAVRGEVGVMGYDYERPFHLFAQTEDEVVLPVGGFGVQVAGRFVREYYRRLADQCARQSDPLPFPARQLARTMCHPFAEADGLRVQGLTLGNGENIPWHYHSAVSDIFICLEGTMVVETRAPAARHQLEPGEHCVIPPRTAHEVTGKDGHGCRFTIVQGVGEYDFVPVGESRGER